MTICTTAFVIEAGEGPDPTYEMIGAWVAETFTVTQSAVNWAYWAHMLAICTFLFLIPLSKHMHLVMALPNVFFFDTHTTNGKDATSPSRRKWNSSSFGRFGFRNIWCCTILATYMEKPDRRLGMYIMRTMSRCLSCICIRQSIESNANNSRCTSICK